MIWMSPSSNKQIFYTWIYQNSDKQILWILGCIKFWAKEIFPSWMHHSLTIKIKIWDIMGGKKLSLPGCNEVSTNRGSDKQRIGKTEVPTNISLNKQRFGQTEVRRPFAQPLGSRKYIFFVPLIALKAIFSLLECIKFKPPWMHQSSDKQRFGQT